MNEKEDVVTQPLTVPTARIDELRVQCVNPYGRPVLVPLRQIFDMLIKEQMNQLRYQVGRNEIS